MVAKQKICPEGKVLNPKTNRCVKVKEPKAPKQPKQPKVQKQVEPEWTEQIQKEFMQILAQLRKPKLGNTFTPPTMNKQQTCAKCIKEAPNQTLQKQLNQRKKPFQVKESVKVNILVPRKKNK